MKNLTIRAGTSCVGSIDTTQYLVFNGKACYHMLWEAGVNCPYCGHYDSRVMDSRDATDGIRRRRQCVSCGLRFTTYERLQPGGLYVIKKDGRREEFNRDKLLAGITKACEKRPLSGVTLEAAVDNIEMELFQTGRTGIPSKDIGDRVMSKGQ